MNPHVYCDIIYKKKKCAEVDMYPLLLKPIIKNYIWGGERLIKDFGMESEETPAAEAWMLTCRPGAVNAVLNGKYKGRLLSEVPGVDADDFPLLVKLIDAARDLSVQVHPSAECAAKYPGDSEKTEMWYVIDCAEGATLIHGFNENFGSEKSTTNDKTYFSEFESIIKKGRITDILRKAEVRPGDVVFVEPGTVHAIGRGILLAEVQQNSDTTYRVYDYGRVGKDGKPRELHVEKAIDAVRSAKPGSHPYADVTERLSYGTARRISCGEFTAEIVSLDGEFTDKAERFFSVVVLSGDAAVRWKEGELEVSKGASVYVPEGCPVSVAGKGTLLISRPGR